jgi:hypothetical protein
MNNLRMLFGFVSYMAMGLFAIIAYFPTKASDFFEYLGDKLWGGKGNLIGK